MNSAFLLNNQGVMSHDLSGNNLVKCTFTAFFSLMILVFEQQMITWHVCAFSIREAAQWALHTHSLTFIKALHAVRNDADSDSTQRELFVFDHVIVIAHADI